jgi:hypothetical protein
MGFASGVKLLEFSGSFQELSGFSQIPHGTKTHRSGSAGTARGCTNTPDEYSHLHGYFSFRWWLLVSVTKSKKLFLIIVTLFNF